MLKETTISNFFKLLLLIIAILIVLLIYLNGFSIISFKIENETIVLTFVGILATFIIINNHSQVDVVKDNFIDLENKVRLQKDAINSLLKSVDCNLYTIVNDIINKKYAEVEAYSFQKDGNDKIICEEIKVKISIKKGNIVCHNIDTGEIVETVLLKNKTGILNLDKDKLYTYYKLCSI